MNETKTLLGLPMRDPFAALASTALALVVLLTTTSRSIGPFDGGELAVAAYELGLGHPPGQPLHAMLGFLFAHLPFVDPATGLASLSAIAAALSILPTWALARSFVPEARHRLLAPVSLLSVALHGIAWEPATRIEVYPLAVFFGLMAMARYATLHETEDERRGALAAGAYLGLSACANPVVATIAMIASLAFLLERRPGIGTRLGASILGGLLGLLPYAYLAFVARRQDAFVWGGLDSTREVLHFLTGRDFARNLSAPLATRIAQAMALLDHLASDRMALALLVSGLLGAAVSVAGRRIAPAVALLIALLLTLALISSNVIFAVDVPDYLGYLALPLSLLAASSVAAADAAIARTPVGALLPVAMIVSAVLSSPVAWQRTRSSDDVCMRVAREILDEADVGSIVVVDSDHLAGPLLYAQRVERTRTDVIVVVRGLMSSSWYLELLERQHRDLLPFAVRGEGGRDGRLRRLIGANRERAVRVESLDLSSALGLVACPGGITLRTGEACRGSLSPRLARLSELARHTWRLPSGAVEGKMVMTAITYRIGLDLYRLGLPQDAYGTLVLGLPPDYLRAELPPPSAIRAEERLMHADFPFRRARAIGEPARNAFVAATLLARSGQVDPAVRLLSSAAAEGLPEAEEMLRRSAD